MRTHKHLNRAEALEALRSWVDRNGGDQRSLAVRAGVSDAFVSAVFLGKSPSIPDSLLEVVGWEGVVMYRPKEQAAIASPGAIQKLEASPGFKDALKPFFPKADQL